MVEGKGKKSKGKGKEYYGDSSQMESDLDSDVGRKVKVKEKSKSMGGYACLKIMNSLLYNLTLCFAIGYFYTTKFTSQFTFYMFSGVLIGRPALITFYSLTMICIESQRKNATKKAAKKAKKAKKKSGDYSDSDMSDFNSDVDANPDFMNNSYVSQ